MTKLYRQNIGRHYFIKYAEKKEETIPEIVNVFIDEKNQRIDLQVRANEHINIKCISQLQISNDIRLLTFNLEKMHLMPVSGLVAL